MDVHVDSETGVVEEVLSPLDPRAYGLYLERESKRRVATREVCICGHSMNYHTEVAGESGCKPAKVRCACREARAVLRADNLRKFLSATTGDGMDHALAKGILASQKSGDGYEWIESPLLCDRCQEVVELPIPIDASSVVPGANKILCGECYNAWKPSGQ